MSVLLFVPIVAAWLAVGAWGFVYWWTSDYDFTRSEVPWALFVGGALGPLAWPFGLVIHGGGDRATSRTIVRRR
jgi:hypothetical protein